MKMNPVVHFEMPYEDKNRMAGFYTNVFGWHIEMLGQEMGNYVLATTTETDQKTSFPKEPGRINGGFYEKMEDARNPSIVIAVDDIKEAMKNIEKEGGRIIGGMKRGEPDDIPGVGLYIAFIDTEGNRVGILQSTPMSSVQ